MNKTLNYICYKTSEHFTKGEIVPIFINNDGQIWTKHEASGKLLKVAVTPDYIETEDFKELNLISLKEYRKMKLNQFGML